MIRIVLPTVLIVGAAFCQPAGRPAFDVASVKTSPKGEFRSNPIFGTNVQVTPGSVTLRHVSLKGCIEWAYHLFEYQVSGPSWIDSDHYDVVAKAAGPANQSDLRVMLQALLADRFQLKFHRQIKEAQAYVLSVAKNGPKFHESTTDGESDIEPDQRVMSVRVRRVSVSQLIDPLSRIFQTPVVDMTGLTGRYDVEFNVAKYIPQSGEKADPQSLIQTALQEELGLKLEGKKMRLDFLIVDQAEKPTEN